MKYLKNITVIILMIIILIILSVKTEAVTGKINVETVNIRKGPSTDSEILDQLNKDDELEILEEENGWYKVNVNIKGENSVGYVSKKLIDIVQEEQPTTSPEETNTSPEETNTAQEETVQTNNTDIQAEPKPIEEPLTDIDSSEDIKEEKEYILQQEVGIKILPLMSSIEKAKISGKIKTIEIINDWCRIENDTEIGWIRINNLKKSITQGETPENNEQTNESTQNPTENENPESSTTVSTTLNKTGYVTVEGLTIRKGPKMSSEAIGGLSKNDQVEIIGEEDGWYKINLDEGYGYVSAKYISDTKVAETTSRNGSTITQPEISPIETEKDKIESTTSGENVVEYAKQYLGYKYVSGGTSPTTGFDCSGFTRYVYKHFGITLNRTSKDQIKNGVAVEKNNLQLGDIVLFNNDSNTVIGHVGIYIGNNNFIHASNPREGVKITSLSSSYYKIRYVGARRVI